MTSDFEGFLSQILIPEKEPVFLFLMLSAKQGNYWYHFYNVLNRDLVLEALRGGVAQWVACLTHNMESMGSNPIKGPHYFLEQETLPLLLWCEWHSILPEYQVLYMFYQFYLSLLCSKHFNKDFLLQILLTFSSQEVWVKAMERDSNETTYTIYIYSLRGHMFCMPASSSN